jgi:hypothetical protein
MVGSRNVSQELLTEWERRLSVNIAAHNLAERRFHWLDNVMGSIALGTIVLLGTIATTTDMTRGWRMWLVVSVTSLGALCSAFQTQLRLGPTATAHQTAARQYGALRRSVEDALRLPPERQAQRITEIRQQWDNVAGNAPNVPVRIRQQAKAKRLTKT